MPPRQSSRAAAKPKAKAKGQPKQAARRPLSLVQAVDAQETRAVRRRLHRRATEEQYERAHNEHFHNLAPGQDELIMIDDQNLKQHVMAAISVRNANRSQGRLGSTFWASLKLRVSRQLAAGAEVQDPFHVPDNTLPLDPALVSALRLARHANTTTRSKAALTAWMTTTTAVNFRELAGLGKHMVTIRATSSDSAMQLCLEFLRMLARLNLTTTHRVFWQDGLRNWADEVLVTVLAQMRRGGLGVQAFWDTHAAVASLLVSSQAVQAVLACGNRWLQVTDHIAEVCKSSNLGLKLFAFAQTIVASIRVSAFMNDELAKLTSPVSKAKQQAWIDAVMAEVTRLDVQAVLSSLRLIDIDYKGLTLSRQITGVAEEISLRWGAWIRVHARGLESLTFEDDLFGAASGKDFDVDEEVLAPVKVARATLLKVISESGDIGYSEICRQRAPMLVMGDQGAKVDIAIGDALVGQGGEAFMHDRLLQRMPSPTETKTLQHALQLCEALKEGHLYKVVSSAAQAGVNSTIAALGRLIGGLPPQKSLFVSGKLAEVFDRFQWFCTATDEDRQVVLRGKAAIDYRFQQVTANAAEATLTDLEPLHIYGYLLTPQQQQTVADTTRTARAAVQGNAPARRQAAGSGQGNAPARRQAAAPEADDVMALFGV